jgi:hypothetical protein
MRWAIFLAPALLCGCVTDNGTAFVASVAALPAALTTQDNLEFDLIKDLVRKSSELEFISSRTYSCGDPDDRYLISAEDDYRALAARYPKKKMGFDAITEARKKLREKNALLASIALYGTMMKALAADYQTAQDVLGAVKSDVDALKAGGGLSEAGTVLTALSAVLVIAQKSAGLLEAAEVQRAAIRMQNGLQDAAKKLKDEHVLAGLTRDEAVAFSYWDACALERLRFVRDYYPSVYPPGRILVDSKGHMKLQGMTQTSVLDFAKEYRQYLLDRETFIGRRPNYISVIDAIVKANADIIKAPDGAGIIAALKALADLTTSIQPAAVTLSKTSI